MSGFIETSDNMNLSESEVEYCNDELGPKKKCKSFKDSQVDVSLHVSTSSLVDIDELLQEFYKWKSTLETLESTNNKLNENLISCQHKIENSKTKEQHLYHENSQLKEIIFNQQQNLKSLSVLEEENLKLTEKITTLEETIKELKSEQYREKYRHSEKLNELERRYRMQLQEQITASMESREMEEKKFHEQLRMKEEEIQKIHSYYSEIENSYKDKLKKSTIDYEEKLLKLQGQVLKSNKTSSSISSTMTTDIFRQKLFHMQRDYESKISILNQTINKLQEKLQSSYIPESPKRRTSLLSDRKKDNDFYS